MRFGEIYQFSESFSNETAISSLFYQGLSPHLAEMVQHCLSRGGGGGKNRSDLRTIMR